MNRKELLKVHLSLSSVKLPSRRISSIPTLPIPNTCAFPHESLHKILSHFHCHTTTTTTTPLALLSGVGKERKMNTKLLSLSLKKVFTSLGKRKCVCLGVRRLYLQKQTEELIFYQHSLLSLYTGSCLLNRRT